MSPPRESKWRWRPPAPPYGIHWPENDRPSASYFVTRHELETLGIPIGVIFFARESWWDELDKAGVPEHDRPMTWYGFENLMAEVRAEWRAAGYGDEGPPLPRALNERQLQFARNIAMGFSVSDAHERAGYRRKASNAARLLRDELVVEEILQHLALAG